MINIATADYSKLKTEYLRGNISYRELAKKHGVSFSTLRKVAAKEHWTELRNKTGAKRDIKIVDSLSETEAKKAVDKLTRVSDLTDRLLDKLEQAIEELDIQLYKDVKKTKEIEYNNEKRPDKPTKEIIHEEEKVIEIKTIVDRSGLKAIASSLRDIKEIQMLKSELDKMEQMARIAKLQKEAQEEDNSTTEIKVTFASDDGEDTSKWAE